MRILVVAIVFSLVISTLFGNERYFYRNGKPVKITESQEKRTFIAAKNLVIPAIMVEGTKDFRYLTGHLYIKPSAAAPEKISLLLKKYRLNFVSRLFVENWIYAETMDDPVDTARRLVQNGDAIEAEPGYFVKPVLYGIDPLNTDDTYFTDQWQLHNNGPFTTLDGKAKIRSGDHAHVAQAWQLLKLLGINSQAADIASDLKLAVIDDGFDILHEEIANKIAAYSNFGGPVETGNLFAETVDTGNFHGMMVLGIAAAQGGNGLGISGSCPGCKVVLARMAADPTIDPNLTADQYFDKIFSWVMEQNPDVINCSWGPDGSLPASYFTALVDKITTQGRGGKGTVIVFASGNSGEDFSWNALASHPSAISVGASNSEGVRYSFSNFGPALDLVAPTSGAEKQSTSLYYDRIWTTDNFIAPACLTPGKTPSSGCHDTSGWTPDGNMAGGDGWMGKYSYRFSHTSSAAPLVSGIAALVLEANKGLNAIDVRDILASTADKINKTDAAYDGSGHSDNYGYGRVNALRAVAKAYILGGGTISDQIKKDIDESSPCTVADCWDFSGSEVNDSESMPVADNYAADNYAADNFVPDNSIADSYITDNDAAVLTDEDIVTMQDEVIAADNDKLTADNDFSADSQNISSDKDTAVSPKDNEMINDDSVEAENSGSSGGCAILGFYI